MMAVAARKKRKRMGRPPLSPGDKHDERVVAHLRKRDLKKLEKWAVKRGIRVGELVREILEKALGRRRS